MPVTYLAPDPCQSTQFIPGGAVPANGGLLFFYLAGTSTKSTVYKDNAAGTSWTNPIVLDSGGNLPSGGEVWFAQGISYKVVFAPSTDSDPPVSPYWTKDNLSGINDISATTSEWIAGPTPTFVSATSFTLVGDQTAIFMVGRRVRTTNTGGTVYATITSSVFGALTTVIVKNDSGAIDSGLSAVAYSLLAGTNVSVPQASFNVQPQIGGRLTLASGQPVTSSDVASTILFWTPYLGNTVDLYDGSANWNRYSFAEISTVVPVATGVQDIFLYATSGALAFTTQGWTNNTTRASTISFQNGMPVLTNDTTKLLLGTYWATSGVVPDTKSSRALWNYWNRQDRPIYKVASTGQYIYPAASTAITVLGGDSTNAITGIFGDAAASARIVATLQGRQLVVTTTGLTMRTAIGVDAFNNMSSGVTPYVDAISNNFAIVSAHYNDAPGIGLHTFSHLLSQSTLTSVVYSISSATGISTALTGTLVG